MPIISKAATRRGRLIKLSYTFNDGTVRSLSVRGDSDAIANMLLLQHEPNVLVSKQHSDVDAAIEANSDAAQPDATQVQVYKAWMFRGYHSDDPVEAYKYLVKVAQKVIDLGLTGQQLANAFNEDVETINLVLAKWQYLKTNKDILLAYKTVEDGL